MWEVWEFGDKLNIYRPVAWFNEEGYAREYAEYLEAVGNKAKIVYNETAVMPDWDNKLGLEMVDNPV